ncbi:MAG: MFS transporter, partial [Lysobacter sp.]|nr:MFS transporter [Lysobacter sp.]
MATWFFLTLYLQDVRGLSPVQTGVAFLPLTAGIIGGSQISFRTIGRFDARLLALVGGLVAAAGLGGLGFLAADTSLAWVIGSAAVSMLGGGLMMAPVTVAATSNIAADQGGLASGLLNTTRHIGGALGLAVLAT